MITITKNLKVTSGTAPYAYTWLNTSSCVTIPIPVGISLDGNISTVIKFFDDTCLTNAIIKLLVTDADGCTNTFTVPITSPCSSLTVTPIQYEGDFTFSAGVTGGTPTYQYVWQYDGTYFAQLPPTNSNVLKLAPLIPFSNDTSTEVKLTVTDAKGCVKIQSYALNFCAPTAAPKYVSLICDALNSTANKTHVLLDITSCNNVNIDWNSLTFGGLPTGMTVTKGNYPTEPNAVDVTCNTNLVVPGNYTGFYTIANNFNVVTTAIFTVFVPTCVAPSLIQGISASFNLPCPATIGATVTVDLSNYVFSSHPINWATFAFSPLTGQTSPTQTTLTGLLGNAAVNLNHILTYTQTSTSVASEAVQWTVCNTNGDCAYNINLTFVNYCPAPPVAVNDSYCAVCGQATAYLAVTANDTGVFNSSTVTIVTPPAHGSALVDTSGKISYTPVSNYSGVDTLTYNVTNLINGAVSNNATVTFTVVCAGTSAQATACN